MTAFSVSTGMVAHTSGKQTKGEAMPVKMWAASETRNLVHVKYCMGGEHYFAAASGGKEVALSLGPCDGKSCARGKEIEADWQDVQRLTAKLVA